MADRNFSQFLLLKKQIFNADAEATTCARLLLERDRKIEELRRQVSLITQEKESLIKQIEALKSEGASNQIQTVEKPATEDTHEQPSSQTESSPTTPTTPTSAGFVPSATVTEAPCITWTQDITRSKSKSSFIPFFSFFKTASKRFHKKIPFKHSRRISRDCQIFAHPSSHLTVAVSMVDRDEQFRQEYSSEISPSSEDDLRSRAGSKNLRKRKSSSRIDAIPARKRKLTKSSRIVETSSQEYATQSDSDSKVKDSPRKVVDSSRKRSSAVVSKVASKTKIRKGSKDIETNPQNSATLSESDNNEVGKTEGSSQKVLEPARKGVVAKFAASEYIPLGGAFSPLVPATERIAKPLNQSKVLKELKKIVPGPAQVSKPVALKMNEKKPASSKSLSVESLLLFSDSDEVPPDVKSDKSKDFPQLHIQHSDEIPSEQEQLLEMQTEFESAPNTRPDENSKNNENISECLPDISKPPPNVLSVQKSCVPKISKPPPSMILPLDLSLKPSDTISLSNSKDVTFLEEMMNHYDKRREISEKMIAEKNRVVKPKIDPYEVELSLGLVQAQLKKLWAHTKESDLRSIVASLTTTPTPQSLIHLRKNQLLQCLFIEIKLERVHDRSSTSQPPFLSAKQKKILCLLDLLTKNQDFESVVEDLLEFIRFSLFSRDRIIHFRKDQLSNLTKMYFALCRYKGDDQKARAFFFDVIFRKHTRTHVMLASCIETWPEILSRPNEQKSTLDPLAETVVWIIYNRGSEMNSGEMKVYKTRELLSSRCGFLSYNVTGTHLVQYLIKIGRSNVEDVKMRYAATKSLQLLSRWQEPSWSLLHIINPLLNVLRDISSNNDFLISWVLDCVGLVSRGFTADQREAMTGIFDSIKGILCDEKRSVAIENVALRALLYLGQHLQAQVSKFFTTWKPKHPLCPEVETLLIAYVGTRASTFSRNLINGIKRRRLAATMNNFRR